MTEDENLDRRLAEVRIRDAERRLLRAQGWAEKMAAQTEFERAINALERLRGDYA